jgi:transcription elongation factor Elf1
MDAHQPDKSKKQLKVSAHVCPQCSHASSLKGLPLLERSMGVITCPQCNWSGPVDIGVVEEDLE